MKSGSTAALVIAVILMFVALFLLGAGLALLGNTFVAWWIPAIVAIVPAAATALPLMPRWQHLLGFSKLIATLPFHLLLVGSVTFFLFLGINQWCADKGTAHVEHTTVIEKFRKEHTRYRRVSRNRRVPDGKYYSWHLKLQLADGRTINREVPLSTYRNTSTGSHRDLTLAIGFFGFPVIK